MLSLEKCCCLVGYLVVVVLSDPLFGQGRQETIVSPLQPPPIGDGTGIFIEDLKLNNSGQLAYLLNWGRSDGSGETEGGIYRTDIRSGSTTTILRHGQYDPGGTYQFSTLGGGSLSLNESGTVAARINIAVPDLTPSIAIVTGDGTLTNVIARTGQTAPGGTGQFEFLGTPDFNDMGSVVFDATTTVEAFRGLFRSDGGAVAPLAIQGDLLPNGNAIASMPSLATINQLGEVAFRAADTAGGSGIYVRRDTGLETIAAIGQPTPDGNGFYQASSADHYPIQMNGSGSVAYSFGLTGASDGSSFAIFTSGGMDTRRVVSNIQTVADSSYRFSDFLSFAMNSSGQVGFFSRLESTVGGADQVGLYREAGGTITEIVRSGRSYGSTVFSAIEDGTYHMNNSGQVVFNAGVDGYLGAVVTGDGRDLIEIVRPGDNMMGYIVGQSFRLNELSLNDYGQVAYSVALYDAATGGNIGQALQLWTPELHWRNASSGQWSDRLNWTLSLNPADVHDVLIDCASDVTVTGPTIDSRVRSLQIGGGLGQATLALQNFATVAADHGVTIRSNGTLTGEGIIAGAVINRGTIDVKDIAVTISLDNHGLISGNGRLVADLSNEADGLISVAAGRQLELSGARFSNAGTIEVSTGGSLTINHDAWNSTGPISVKNAGQLNLGGSFNTASMDSIALEPGGRAHLVGTLDNVGSSTVFESGWHLSGGAIVGGTIDASELAIDGGYLYGVHVESHLNIDQPSGYLFVGGASTVDGDIHVGHDSFLAIGQDFGLSAGQHLVLGNAGSPDLGYVAGSFGTELYFAGDSVIEGNGWITSKSVSAATVVDGVISPGFSTGLLNLVNDWKFGDSSITKIELAGPGSFDRIDVYGNLILGGRLDVSLMSGFTMLGGMDFQFLTTLNGSRIGFFEGLGQDALVGHFGAADLFIDYTAGDGDDVRLYSISAVPEPSSLALLMCAVCSFVLRRSRSRTALALG